MFETVVAGNGIVASGNSLNVTYCTYANRMSALIDHRANDLGIRRAFGLARDILDSHLSETTSLPTIEISSRSSGFVYFHNPTFNRNLKPALRYALHNNTDNIMLIHDMEVPNPLKGISRKIGASDKSVIQVVETSLPKFIASLLSSHLVEKHTEQEVKNFVLQLNTLGSYIFRSDCQSLELTITDGTAGSSIPRLSTDRRKIIVPLNLKPRQSEALTFLHTNMQLNNLRLNDLNQSLEHLFSEISSSEREASEIARSNDHINALGFSCECVKIESAMRSALEKMSETRLDSEHIVRQAGTDTIKVILDPKDDKFKTPIAYATFPRIGYPSAELILSF